ncbi:MAG: PHP domain-containing protein [Candidatus Hydrogenedentota bacterium]
MENDAKYADFHLHSTCSDGSDPPATVIERAAAHGLAAATLTDHDTLAGVQEAQAAGERLGVEVLTGVEISTRFRGVEQHVLGLGVRLDDPDLNRALARLLSGRAERASQIVTRLNDLRIPIEVERVFRRSAEGAVGRMHIAQELVEIGFAKTVQDTFDKYLKSGRPAFVSKPLLDSRECIGLIKQAGGLSFIAHPGIVRRKAIVAGLLDLPFDGLEVFHSKHSSAQSEQFLDVCRERGLLVTGGSDCHGTIKGQSPEMGKVKLAWEHVERIYDALAARR